MAKVRKLNRILTVNDNAIEGYLKQGYDQIDDEGKVIKEATGGKTVSVAKYNDLLAENTTLKEQLADAQAQITLIEAAGAVEEKETKKK